MDKPADLVEAATRLLRDLFCTFPGPVCRISGGGEVLVRRKNSVLTADKHGIGKGATNIDGDSQRLKKSHLLIRNIKKSLHHIRPRGPDVSVA